MPQEPTPQTATATATAEPPAKEPEKEPGSKTPDEPFDRERAMATIQRQREEEAAAKREVQELRGKLQEVEDRDKSEVQKATEKLTKAEERAAAAERTSLQLQVALDEAPEGMTIAQIRKLAGRLTGKDRAEMEADAKELFADFTPAKQEEDEGGKRRPRERLKPGAVPDAEPDETNPEKLAAQVPRRY